MNSEKTFNSNVKAVGGGFARDISNEQIKSEPMFFNSDLEYAYKKGSAITRSFIDSLPDDWLNAETVFDSRVHMLMPEWYPAIPGYHHDDVPRPPIKTGEHFITAGQPDYDNPRYLSEHLVGLVNADVSPTNFAVGESSFSQIPDGEVIYRHWHEEVLEKLSTGELELFKAKDRTLYEFDWQTWHTAQEAVAHGWRWFGRLSRNTERTEKITNEIRVNAQCYMKMPFAGW